MHQCHSSHMSGNMSPNAFPQLSIETCSASPHDIALCSACILGEEMVHPPCSAESGFPSFGHWAWVGEGARGSSVGQSCVGGRRLPARTGLSAECQISWHFVVLAVGLESPPRYQPNTVPPPALIQGYSLTVKTRRSDVLGMMNSV